MSPDSLQIITQVTKDNNSLDSIVRILTLAVSVFNLFLIYHIFSSNRKFNKNAIIVEKKCIWFRQLAIEPNLSKIHSFYEDSLRILNEGKAQIVELIKTKNDHKEIVALSQATIEKFNDKITELRKGLMDIVWAFNPEFGGKIYRFFDEDLQDKITPKFDELVIKGEACECKFSDLLREHKINLFKKLYSYEMIDLIAPIAKTDS